MTIDPTMRDRALKLLARGAVTVSEAAAALGISRQAVQQWVDKAGLDPVNARAVFVRKLFRCRR